MSDVNALEIINAVKRDTQHVDESGFPLEVFPAKMQEILLHWAEHENYKVEYAAMAMLTAIAAGMGNTYRIRIRGEWTTNAAMYVILVGRPGLGKTPPLEAAMLPLVELDEQRLEKFKQEMEGYQEETKGKKGEEQAENKTPKPKLIKTVISDFTPEKMILVHADNLRGIIIHVDEVMGLFNSANRYSNSPIIEQLLSAWSGSPLDYSRVSNPVPIHIGKPCISIIGTTQTTRVNELMQKGFKENGLLDRILFVLPKSQKIAEWKVEDLTGNSSTQEQSSVMADKWRKIMQKVFELDYHTYLYDGEEKQTSHVLTMHENAAQVLASWWNDIASKNNAVENDCDVESRDMKLPTHVARLALLFQVARFACNESHLEFVDAVSVRAAIKVMDYLEDSYVRIKDAIESEPPSDQLSLFYKLLPEEFTTARAIKIGDDVGIKERTVKGKLKEFADNGKLHRICQGKYRKPKQSPPITTEVDHVAEKSSDESEPSPSENVTDDAPKCSE